MSKTNLRRDATWCFLGEPAIDWSSGYAITTSKPLTNSDGLVGEDAKSCFSSTTVAPSAKSGEASAVGLLMRPTLLDAGLYRVFARVEGSARLIVGYAPAAATGSDDEIEKVCQLPFENSFDDVVAVPGLEQTSENFKQPLAFAVQIGNSSIPVCVSLSVQRLAGSPPKMNLAVS